MRDIEETAAVVALLRRRDRLWHHYAALVEETGSAVDVLRGNFEEFLPEAPGQLFSEATVSGREDLAPIVDEVEDWLREGINVITVLDDEYPLNLRTIHNRPPILFVHGQLEPEDARSVAVVGSRAASPEGLAKAGEIAVELSETLMVLSASLPGSIQRLMRRCWPVEAEP